jgi:hypothetical protein
LVCGGRSLDFEALQGAARYEDGYTPASPVIRWFWEVRPLCGFGGGAGGALLA